MSDTQPDEVDRPENDSRSAASGLAWFGGTLAIYLGVFVLITLDGLVFRTHFASRWFPSLGRPIRILYFPLLWMMYRLGLIAALPPIF